MMWQRRIPLAWKNLTHDRRRLAVAVAGIGFAVLLMFMQVGIQNALFDSQVKLIDDLKADIFLVNKAKYTLASEKRFPMSRVHQARSVPGVQGVYPFYSELTTSVLKNLTPGKRNKGFPIRTMGYFLSDPVFQSDEIASQATKLRRPGAALIDVRSKRKNFDFPVHDADALATQHAELAGREITLVGSFSMGTDFAHDGNLIMSAENFSAHYPHRNRRGDPLAVVDLGLVQIEPGVNVEACRDLIDELLEDDVWVYTREAFRRQEIEFWDESTPIGIIFAAGKVIGFIVGMVICYQVIYSDIADHMPEFATLKAMGYSSWYFLRMIVVESTLLSAVGFVPGLLLSWALYDFVADATGLLMRMTLDAAFLVLALTVVMCIASGLLAVRKLLSADPANLF